MTTVTVAPDYSTVAVEARSVTATIEATETVINVVTSPIAVTVALPGMQGPQGADGAAAEAINLVAGENVGGHRAVSSVGGSVYYTDPTDLASASALVGMTTGAATTGHQVQIATTGSVTEPSWSFSTGPVWVGASGTLTQTIPTTGAVIQLGVATGPHSLIVSPRLLVFGG